LGNRKEEIEKRKEEIEKRKEEIEKRKEERGNRKEDKEKPRINTNILKIRELEGEEQEGGKVRRLAYLKVSDLLIF